MGNKHDEHIIADNVPEKIELLLVANPPVGHNGDKPYELRVGDPLAEVVSEKGLRRLYRVGIVGSDTRPLSRLSMIGQRDQTMLAYPVDAHTD